MDISPIDAQKALSAADEAVESVKRAFDRQASRIVLVWSAVYFLAPLSMHFWPMWGTILQQSLLIAAIAYTIWDSRRNTFVTGVAGQRVGGLWFITYAFGWIWFFILAPANFQNPEANVVAITRQMWAYGVSLAMFVYVVMGLWVGRLYVITGLVVALCTLVGLLWFGNWYWLWCAVSGGGTLLVAGLCLRRQKRT